ncbi:MAG: gluconolaconase [Bacteroidales bacterium]|nr:gluconolaconase [Bacteroidales bacterium]
MIKYKILSVVLLLFLVSCTSQKKKSGEDAGDATTVKKFELVEVWKTDTLFRVPECVFYDKDNDVIYVSNMNDNPREKDGNGFISRLSTSGEILDLEWVADMSSPKGLGIYEGKLYVSDVDEVIVIDIAEGEIVERIVIEGAKMINDISIDSQGNLYVSDSDNNNIFLISNGVVSNWLSEGLNSPNGVLVDGESLLLASMGSEDFAVIDLSTKELTVLTEDISKGDGIAKVSIPGHFLVTDWFGQVFMIYPDGSKVILLDTREAEIGAADIDYIPEKNLLLVPTFAKDHVVAYNLVEKED